MYKKRIPFRNKNERMVNLMKKTLISLFLAVVMMLSVMPACIAETDDAPYTITYISSRSATEPYMLCLNEIVSMYQETHPNFTMEVENIADRTSYLQKIKILAASNELPDWFDADPESFFASMVDAGYVYNMEELYDELGLSDRFFGISKEYARLGDGRLYLFTWQCNAEYFFYNKTMFADAGIETLPTTMDELIECCDKLVEAGYTPFAMGGAAAWPILRYFAFVPFRMAGNAFIENACAGTESFGSETGITAATWMQKLATYFQEGWTTADYDTMVDLFTSGQTAMLYNGTWVLSAVVDDNMELREEFGVFGMPTYSENDVTGQFDYFANSGIGTAVLTESMDDQMKDFMKFFFETYPDLLITKYDSLPSLMPSDTSNLPEIYVKVMNDAMAVNTYAKCWDVVIDAASLDTLNSETMNLALGVITPEEWAVSMDAAVAENIG